MRSVRGYNRLQESFYNRNTLDVAPDLLGCLLRHETKDGVASGIIVETEAYLDNGDGASHARFGKTPRSKIMFGNPGRAYVYFVYGMHYLLNAVTEEEGIAGAVLIRACKPVEGLKLMEVRRGRGSKKELMSGPGKLCQALGITTKQNEVDLAKGPLGIYRRQSKDCFKIETTARIGVVGSTEEPYRFLIKDCPYVSVGT